MPRQQRMMQQVGVGQHVGGRAGEPSRAPRSRCPRRRSRLAAPAARAARWRAAGRARAPWSARGRAPWHRARSAPRSPRAPRSAPAAGRRATCPRPCPSRRRRAGRCASSAASAWCVHGASTPVASNAARRPGSTQSGQGACRPERAGTLVHVQQPLGPRPAVSRPSSRSAPARLLAHRPILPRPAGAARAPGCRRTGSSTHRCCRSLGRASGRLTRTLASTRRIVRADAATPV